MRNANKVKKGNKQGNKLKQYRNSARNIIARGINSGYLDLMTEKLGTFDVEVLIKSKAGLEKLKRDMKWIREKESRDKKEKERLEKFERSKLVKEANKIAKEQIKEVKKEYGNKTVLSLQNDRAYKNLPVFNNFSDKKHSNDDIRLYIHEMKTVDTITHAENMLNEKIDDFFDSYFKELRLNAKDKPKIKKLKDYFRGNLSEYYDFVDEVKKSTFTREYSSGDGKSVDVYGYRDEMRRRLDRMLNMKGLNKEEKKK